MRGDDGWHSQKAVSLPGWQRYNRAFFIHCTGDYGRIMGVGAVAGMGAKFDIRYDLYVS